MAPTDPAPNGSDSDVFGSLPRSRPQRRSAKRDRPAPASGEAAAAPEARAAKAGTATAKATRKRTASAAPEPAREAPAGSAPQPPPASAVPPSGYATPGAGGDPALHGFRLLTTAIEAVGELFLIGITATSQALREALHRLPRP